MLSSHPGALPTGNQRKQRRLPLQLVLSIDTPRRLAGTHCVSRDVSAGGMYFYAEAWDDAITQFEFCTILPTQVTTASPVVAKCSGTVPRVERETPGNIGVAAKVECRTVM